MQERSRWGAAIGVALALGIMNAIYFLLEPPQDDIGPLRLLFFGSSTAIAFLHAALRIRTGLVWPLIATEVVTGITYYLTLPPHPSPYPLTSFRLVYFSVEIAAGLLLGALALGLPAASTVSSAAARGAGYDIWRAGRVTTARQHAQTRRTSARYAGGCLGLLLGVAFLSWAIGDAFFGPHFTAPPQVQENSGRLYAAHSPGTGCDSGDAYWIEDPEQGYACQADGLLMMQKGFDYPDELFFSFVDEYRGSEIFVALSYRVEVNATIVSGDPGTCVGMHVHVQDFSGRQWFMACTDGTWNIGRCDLYCEQDVTLMQGTFTPGIQTFALSVEVTDTAMAFYFNGEQLAFLEDGAYRTTSQVVLALDGPNDPTNLPGVVFSDFRYMPLV
jgi:hypothetical protein